ncbi:MULTISPECIES: extracellular solute-binding protein [Paenibacillus]|uniref:Extracellular solute-binding protein family 1 n=1 Tax=Paenibacillus lactis 154 TaxID=743719 RepID=G4HCE9_9BACL|nr:MULTISPECIES: extracellular solute-binding protein [Paenibacillus]EHB65725.1 extracellular solute-binding protein family 1 [Paenibacillus lactis 154]MCM3493563.1 extracellular solute-binding protein [Paenibacillus lactis]
MSKMKKPLLVMASALLVLVTVMTGCTKSNEGSPPPTNNPPKTNEQPNEPPKENTEDKWVLGEKPLQFSAYAHYQDTDFPKWESTPIGKYLSEEKQVKIDMIKAAGAHTQKLSAMMASDDLPDMIWTDRDHPDMDRLEKAGKLVPYDDYLDKYTNLKTWMGDDLNLLRSADGKLYRFPNWYSSRPFGNAGYAVNKKIYEELGSPKLETTDDLYNYLVKVKEKYGDQVVPFEPHRAQERQGLGVLYTAFGEGASYTNLNANLLAVPKDSKLTSLLTDPVFREAQKYISKLYREKLISQDAFNQTEDQVKEKVMTGRVAVYASANPTLFASEAHKELTKTDPNAGYFMIWPIRKEGLDKNKIYPGTYTSFGWNAAYITTAAEDPEAIFAFLDWYTGPEGMNVQFFGPEGKNWKGFDEEGKPNFTENYDPKEVAEIQTKNDKVMFVGNTSYIDPAKWKYMESLPVEEQDWVARYQQTITWPTQLNVTEFTGLNPPTDSEEGIIRTSVDELFLEIYAKSSMAASDEEVDKILDQGNKDLMDLGYDRLLEWRTVKWQENLAKMQK